MCSDVRSTWEGWWAQETRDEGGTLWPADALAFLLYAHKTLGTPRSSSPFTVARAPGSCPGAKLAPLTWPEGRCGAQRSSALLFLHSFLPPPWLGTLAAVPCKPCCPPLPNQRTCLMESPLIQSDHQRLLPAAAFLAPCHLCCSLVSRGLTGPGPKFP